MRMSAWKATLAVVVVLGAGACGGEAEREPPAGTGSPGSVEASAGPAAVQAPASEQPWLADAEQAEELAEEGAELFQEKGCVGCHVIGGEPAAAPDLAGVTQRRSWEWLRAMVTHPDSMVMADDTARALLGRYMVQMPNLQLTEQEVRQLVAYIHRQAGS